MLINAKRGVRIVVWLLGISLLELWGQAREVNVDPPIIVYLQLGLAEVFLIRESLLSVSLEVSGVWANLGLNGSLHVDEVDLRDELGFYVLVEWIICH